MTSSAKKSARATRAEPKHTAPKKRAPTQKGKNVRISDELYKEADECSNISRRSVQKQIEYWSQLGRLVEMNLRNADLFALLSEDKFISEIILSNNNLPTADVVMAELEQGRATGKLKSNVTQSKVVYDIADDGKTIRQIDVDGVIRHGDLIGGEFVETYAE